MKTLKSLLLTAMVAASTVAVGSTTASAMTRIETESLTDPTEAIYRISDQSKSTLVSYGYYYVPDVPYAFPQNSHQDFINFIDY